MIWRTVFEEATGRILKTIMAPESHAMRLREGENWIEGSFEDDKYQIVDGLPILREVISDATGQDVTSPVGQKEIRDIRNRMLAQSDWTQVADAPVDQAAWATYRQALRDITDQEGFPTDIVWPVAPQSVPGT